jgi:hypothetical protein
MEKIINGQKYKVEIQVRNRHEALIIITVIHGYVKTVPIGGCFTGLATCLFGSIEEKAKKVADKLIKKHQKQINQKTIVYDV